MAVDNVENDNKKHLINYDGPCPFCGFFLKNPTNNRCPECGGHLKLTLKSPFKITAWFVVLIGIVSSIVGYLNHLGLLLFGVYRVSRQRVPFPWSRGDLVIPWKIIIPETAALLVLTILLVIWWLLNNWFSKQHKNIRIIAGLIGFLLPFPNDNSSFLIDKITSLNSTGSKLEI